MDGFIDDIIMLTIDDPTWVEHAKKLAILVIHIILRPLQTSEPLNRDNSLLIRKLSGCWKLEERNKCLGWDIQIRSLWVLLPKEN